MGESAVPVQMDLRGVSPLPVEMWAQVSPVSVQMWAQVSPVPVQMWQGVTQGLRSMCCSSSNAARSECPDR
jgi:hypothetical protein